MDTGRANTDALDPPPSAWRFSLRAVLIAFAVASIVFAVVQFSANLRERAKRSETTNKFMLIRWALLSVHDVHGRLPHPVRHAGGGDRPYATEHDPDAEELYSWRFATIPYIASYKRDAAFDQAWSSAANAWWRSAVQPYAYDGWGDGVADVRPPASVPNQTRVFAITGPGTAFGDGVTEEPKSLDDIDPDTILIVETRDSGIHWMAPGDFDIRTMPKTINDPGGKGISSRHGSGFHVGFADGVIWYLSNDVPFDQVARFFTVAGAKENDREAVLGPYLCE